MILKFNSFLREKLEGDLGNHESGTLHEILVAHALNGNKHVNPRAEEVHNDYANRLGGTSSPLYQHHLARAQEAAKNIKQHIESQGHEVSHSSWSAQAREKEEGHGDPSDVYVHTKSGKKIGVSLKVGDTHGTKPISNPGVSSEIKTHLDDARQSLAQQHPHTKGMTTAQIKQEARSNPEVGKTVDALRKQTLEKSVNQLHSDYSKMSEPELHQHVMKLLHGGPDYHPDHIRATTTGTGGNYRSKIINPSSHYAGQIEPGKIDVVRSGTSVLFKHKDTGKTLARHRLKFESSGLSSVKGSGESSL